MEQNEKAHFFWNIWNTFGTILEHYKVYDYQ